MKITFKDLYRGGSLLPGLMMAAFSVGTASVAGAQVRPQTPAYPVPGAGLASAPAARLTLPPLPAATPITPNGTVVADVIARVNDQIITRGEYERAQAQLLQEVQQNGGAASDLEARENDLLRDMIDQQLLLSKGKELGITGDSETMRRLDDIRKQNHLDSMEALEKAASQQGVSFEDFKKGIRNNVVTQQVVRDEVGRRLGLTHSQEEAYYNEHAKEFEQPEQIHLSEILIPTTESATDAQVAEAQAKADGLAAKLKAGTSFEELAKTSSGGPTAAAGGDLGDFKRGSLGTILENATFSLPAGGVTAPIRTRQGFVILKVDSKQAGGIPPLNQIEPQVQEAIYLSALQPALRSYLSKARQDAFLDIKPGFNDSGATHRENRPGFTAYAPPPPKKKTVKKQQAQREKAVRAQEKLAEARQKVAAKQAAVVVASSEANARSGKPDRKVKVHREKVRYGQAPRNALPTGSEETAAEATPPPAGQPAAAVTGQPAGLAMAPTTATTSTTTGTGVGTGVTIAGVDNDDPLAPRAAPERKTRFSAREHETEEKKAEASLVKAEAKASVRPIIASREEGVDEKQQAVPLGLNGDTVAKKKPKRKKGEAKERLQDKPKEVETVAPAPASTVNPAIVASPDGVRPATTPPTSDQSTVPATTAAPGAPVQGQPIPSTTSATPGAPKTTSVPPQ